ncbi:hypothetical protein B6V74_14875 [Thioclava sp. F42-5]|nr:hypothetical protein B6V74_14875 [Thioclava sp. F42-5]
MGDGFRFADLRFVHDQLALPKKPRFLTIVDSHSHYCPPTDVRFRYRGEDVVHTLERICSKPGHPKTIRVDEGHEFICRDLDLWAHARQVTLGFSRPGKPTDNGFIEAFNSKLRAECLNARRHCRSDQWRNIGTFMSLAEAAENWRIGANTTTKPLVKRRLGNFQRQPLDIHLIPP